MQINKIQNTNCTPNFGAKLLIFDHQQLVPEEAKTALKELCKSLGKESDKISLIVSKSKSTGVDYVEGLIKTGYIKENDLLDGHSFFKNVQPFYKEFPASTGNESSVIKNFIHVFEEHIFPVFEKTGNEVNKIGREIYNKLFSIVSKVDKK